MDEQKLQRRFGPNWGILLIIFCFAFMAFAIAIMLAPHSAVANNGKVTLSSEDFNQNALVSLDGDWEFYWDKLLTPDDFVGRNKPQVDSLMKVPVSWDSNAVTYLNLMASVI